MKRVILSLYIIIQACAAGHSQQQTSSAELLQGLKKLSTTGSVLYIAAHPDDENTRLLTWLSKERNVRTGYLSLTRGDGGQNLIGKEQGEALGLIRTHELLGARRTDGAEQFFTRANDFGFSKNPDETFKIWGKENILADVVWVIRNFRPDVIVCRFPTTGEGGHGHHTASAILALEAFEAAADPKRFPEQLKYTEVWQARRVFWNTFNFGGNNTTSPDQLKVDVGSYNALLGKSYGEIAADSRSMHKSQGFGSARSRGSQLEYFKLLKGDSVKTDLFEKIDLTWKRYPSAAGIQKLVDAAISKFDPQSPSKSVEQLVSIYNKLKQLPETDSSIKYWKKIKMKETEELIVGCAGLWAEVFAQEYSTAPGKEMSITVQALSRSMDIKLGKITWPGNTDTITSLAVKKNDLYTFKHKEALSPSTPFSNPYWLNEKHSAGTYTIKDQLMIGKPENDASAMVTFHFEIAGMVLPVQRPVVYKFADPVKGEIYRPFEVLPPATVNLSEKAFVFTGNETKKIQFTIKANTDNVSGTIQVKTPAGWTAVLSSNGTSFQFKDKGQERLFEASITSGEGSANGNISVILNVNGVEYSKSIQRIEYDHIPYRFILSDADAKLVKIDLKKNGNNVGYIPGAGDDVPAALKQAGYNVTILTDDLLIKNDLSGYDAIVTGIRAYNTNDRLQVHYDKLMEYVNKGGNLIVQYNTNNRIGPLVAKIAPYPFNITRDRVTDEEAQVTFVKPEHPALNYPNKITQKDFEGWVQERGIYFAGELDKNYETVISMNDPNEKANENSLIIAKYGKGNFVYTGLVFFRELPAGVPGAYRLFANLLSLPKN
jgi:LmbE family N-acetylglucosaminyl deacetylase